MHIPQLLFGHIGYLRQALMSRLSWSLQPRPCGIACCEMGTYPHIIASTVLGLQVLKSALVWAGRAPCDPPLLKDSATCFTLLHTQLQGPYTPDCCALSRQKS